MTPDEIQKDHEAGTLEPHEPDYKAAMLYHSDRADTYMTERDSLTAENAALKARVAELGAALAGMLSHSCVADAGADMKCEEDHTAERKARAALEKSHDRP